jgi:hypothetical protein
LKYKKKDKGFEWWKKKEDQNNEETNNIIENRTNKKE